MQELADEIREMNLGKPFAPAWLPKYFPPRLPDKLRRNHSTSTVERRVAARSEIH